MTSTTRLESLLSLLTSPQAKTQPARQSTDLYASLAATASAAVSSPSQCCHDLHTEPLGAAAVCAHPQQGGRASCLTDARGQPLAEQDVNAAAFLDMPCSGGPASCGGAPTEGVRQPAQAADQGGTACRQVITIATPRPRSPDVRAVPTAKHPARMAQPPHHASGVSGSHPSCSHSGTATVSDTLASPGERRRWEQRIAAALQRAQAAEAAATEARRQAEAAAGRERNLAEQLAAAQSAQRRVDEHIDELRASLEHERSTSGSAEQAAQADAEAAGTELQHTQQQLQRCRQDLEAVQRTADLAVEAAAAARQHDAVAAVSAKHAHKQLEVALQRLADDAATIEQLQTRAAEAAAQRAADVKAATAVQASADVLSAENAELSQRATAAEGFAASFRRRMVAHAAEPELAACSDENMQAYVRLLEQEVARAADAQAALQQRVASAPDEAAARQQALQDRTTAAEARWAAASQELQSERHRVAALERLRLEDARELSRLQAAGEAAHAAGARLATALEALLLGAAAQHRRRQQQQQFGSSKPDTLPAPLSKTGALPAAAPQAGRLVGASSAQQLAGGLPDPAGRLVMLQLREALDV